MPSRNATPLTSDIKKDSDYIRSGLSLLHDFDETYEPNCECKTRGEFIKNAFNYEKPMSSYLKKKYIKNYGLRL